jgi:hypothetical protein
MPGLITFSVLRLCSTLSPRFITLWAISGQRWEGEWTEAEGTKAMARLLRAHVTHELYTA